MVESPMHSVAKVGRACLASVTFTKVSNIKKTTRQRRKLTADFRICGLFWPSEDNASSG